MCLGTFSRRGAVASATIYPCAECASSRSVFIVWKRSFLYDKKTPFDRKLCQRASESKRGTTFVPRNKSISYLSQFYNGNHPVISYSPFFRYPAPKLPSATTSRKPSLSLWTVLSSSDQSAYSSFSLPFPITIDNHSIQSPICQEVHEIFRTS